ncbi:MAG: CAP domain-containing protein [Atribacterota bacterium]|nr:CAP domain-containing protein [Atribacterota bacterium]
MNRFKITISIFIILVILFLSLGFTSTCKNEVVLDKAEATFLNLINKVRTENNLNVLVIDRYLMNTATTRSNEILNGVFAHKPLHNTIKNTTGVTIMVGEILGKSVLTAKPEDFINAWLNSSTHKDVLLNSKYGFTKIGIGITNDKDIQIVVILFSSR